jgi:hypothetical protein
MIALIINNCHCPHPVSLWWGGITEGMATENPPLILGKEWTLSLSLGHVWSVEFRNKYTHWAIYPCFGMAPESPAIIPPWLVLPLPKSMDVILLPYPSF